MTTAWADSCSGLISNVMFHWCTSDSAQGTARGEPPVEADAAGAVVCILSWASAVFAAGASASFGASLSAAVYAVIASALSFAACATCASGNLFVASLGFSATSFLLTATALPCVAVYFV